MVLKKEAGSPVKVASLNTGDVTLASPIINKIMHRLFFYLKIDSMESIPIVGFVIPYISKADYLILGIRLPKNYYLIGIKIQDEKI